MILFPCKDRNSSKPFKEDFLSRIDPVLDPNNWNHGNQRSNHDNYDTWVVPLIQMGQFNINTHSDVTEKFLYNSPLNSEITIITAYFNLPDQLGETMIQHSNAAINILTASHEVSRFLKS